MGEVVGPTEDPVPNAAADIEVEVDADPDAAAGKDADEAPDPADEEMVELDEDDGGDEGELEEFASESESPVSKTIVSPSAKNTAELLGLSESPFRDEPDETVPLFELEGAPDEGSDFVITGCWASKDEPCEICSKLRL